MTRDSEIKNILVVGGTGFIGKLLIDALIKKDYQVCALVRDRKKAIQIINSKCKIIVGDITDVDSLIGCCDGIDMVYHLAAKIGNDKPSDKAFKEFRKVNVEGLTNVIKEAKCAHVKRFVFLSSIAAMGIVKEIPISEMSECTPYLPYQVSKREGELLILKEYSENHFPAIIIRPAKVYGYGEKEYTHLTICNCPKNSGVN